MFETATTNNYGPIYSRSQYNALLHWRSDTLEMSQQNKFTSKVNTTFGPPCTKKKKKKTPIIEQKKNTEIWHSSMLTVLP
jgi:hypothetical protein